MSAEVTDRGSRTVAVEGLTRDVLGSPVAADVADAVDSVPQGWVSRAGAAPRPRVTVASFWTVGWVGAAIVALHSRNAFDGPV